MPTSVDTDSVGSQSPQVALGAGVGLSWLEAPDPYGPRDTTLYLPDLEQRQAVRATWDALQRCPWCARRLEGGQCPAHCRIIGSGHEARVRGSWACMQCGQGTPDRYVVSLEPREPGDDRSTFRASYVARCAVCQASRPAATPETPTEP